MKKGEAIGEKRFAELTKYLIQDKRDTDLIRAISDDTYKEKLYQEYGIK